VLIESDKDFRPLPRPARGERRPFPDWASYRPNSLWIYDTTHFTRCGAKVLIIEDLVSRKWLTHHVSSEETTTQVQAGFTTATAAVSASGMNTPIGVAVDSAGRLWVADANNHRLLRFDAAAGLGDGAAAGGVLGQAGFTTQVPNLGGVSAQSLSFPWSVAYTPYQDALWIADCDNQRVLAHFGAGFALYLPVMRK